MRDRGVLGLLATGALAGAALGACQPTPRDDDPTPGAGVTTPTPETEEPTTDPETDPTPPGPLDERARPRSRTSPSGWASPPRRSRWGRSRRSRGPTARPAARSPRSTTRR